MIFIKGTGTLPIAMDQFLIKCPCCEASSLADVMVVSKYLHFFWVPIVPISKEATTICTKCGFSQPDRSFDPNLISNYYEVKSKFKHPFLSYLGILIIAFITIATVVAFMIK